MKIRVVYLAMLLVLILQVAGMNNNINKTSNSESNRRDRAEKIDEKINSLGNIIDSKAVLTKFPMKLTRCDQIAIFKGKYINDMNDYRKKKEGWFSITAYNVNSYKDQDANQLILSIDISNLNKMPSKLRGALNCVNISQGPDAEITICLDNKTNFDNVLTLLKDFYACRRGDNLKQIPDTQMKKLVKMCQDGDNDNEIAQVWADNKWNSNRLNYFHPQKIKVPGTK